MEIIVSIVGLEELADGIIHTSMDRSSHCGLRDSGEGCFTYTMRMLVGRGARHRTA
jgi:hypothetical protein